MKVGRGSDQFMLRLPEGLRARLKEMAEVNRRSMNSEIVVLLERAAFDPLGSERGNPPAAHAVAAE